MNSLFKLESTLRGIPGPPVIPLLNTPLSPTEVDQLFKTILQSPTKQILDLYTWKNGVASGLPDGQVQFGGMGVFTSLQDAIVNYFSFFVHEFPSFFPITWDDSLLIHIGDSTDETIYLHSSSLLITQPTACYESLFTMFETFVRCFEKGAYFYDDEGLFDQKIDEVVSISSKMNPGCDYWRLF